MEKPPFFEKWSILHFGIDHFCVKPQLIQGSASKPAYLVCELNILETKPRVYELTPGLFLLHD